LEGLNAPSKIYLVNRWLNIVMDSVLVNKGEFELKGIVNEPDIQVLYLNKNSTGFSKTLREAPKPGLLSNHFLEDLKRIVFLDAI